MKNKAIVISLLLNTCIATNAHANTLNNTNYFYFGSKFNTLQPNHIKKSDVFDFKNLYNNYWSHSLYGFLIGYQNNSYFGLEVSYNNLFTNQENIDNITKKTQDTKNILLNYIDSINKDQARKDAEEANINTINENRINTSYDYISNSNFHDHSLLSIKNNQIKKIRKQSAYTTQTQNTNKYSKYNDLKNNKINIIYPQKNLEIAAKFSYPIFNCTDIYSRFGCSINLNKNLFKIKNFKKNYVLKDNIFPIISVGVQYKINKNLYSRIEFEKKITYYSNTKSKNLNSINFHLIWNFQGIFSK